MDFLVPDEPEAGAAGAGLDGAAKSLQQLLLVLKGGERSPTQTPRTDISSEWERSCAPGGERLCSRAATEVAEILPEELPPSVEATSTAAEESRALPEEVCVAAPLPCELVRPIVVDESLAGGDDTATGVSVASADGLHALLREREEELRLLTGRLNNKQAQLATLRFRHAHEVLQLQGLLQRREEELASLRAEHCVNQLAGESQVGPLQAALEEKERENLRLASQLARASWELERHEEREERELEDSVSFLQTLAASSSTSALSDHYDLSTADFIGMGNYGFVATCRSRGLGEPVVLKLLSERWAGVAVREWSHGSALGVHPNIVLYQQVVMHRDEDGSIQRRLVEAFSQGSLHGRRPKRFPECYFCLAEEFMDRGTVQHLVDRSLMTLECLGAITRQVASALAYIHKEKQTHNDVKPDNVLLCQAAEPGHLLVKLADLGQAEYSQERRRDHDMFAYTVWCLDQRERFTKCPKEEQRTASVECFRQVDPTNPLRKALADALDGLWQGKLEMAAVEDLPELQGLTVIIPEDGDFVELEAEAKRAAERRHHIVAMRWVQHEEQTRSMTLGRVRPSSWHQDTAAEFGDQASNTE